MSARAVAINDFLRGLPDDHLLELIAVDIEGLDADVLQTIDWSEFPFHAVSFEVLHMIQSEKAVASRLRQAGYIAAGVGLDARGYDRLFIRPLSTEQRLQAHLWEVERRTWRLYDRLKTCLHLLRP